MTDDFGATALLALPIPALMSGDAWSAVASEALVVVAGAVAVAAAALLAVRRSNAHKGEHNVFAPISTPAGKAPRTSPGRESPPAQSRTAEAGGAHEPAPHAG